MVDMSHDGPWASRIRDHDLLAVYRDGRGRLWCLFYTTGGGIADDDCGAVILEHVTPQDPERASRRSARLAAPTGQRRRQHRGAVGAARRR